MLSTNQTHLLLYTVQHFVSMINIQLPYSLIYYTLRTFKSQQYVQKLGEV